jgi:hypothetical protein
MAVLVIAEAVVARYWWHTSVAMPTVERALPMAAVVPPLLAVSLTGSLVERWPQQLATAARSAVAIRAVRFAAVVAGGLVAALVAAGHTDRTPVLATAAGVALAGLAAPTLQRWTWMPLMLAGYAWLQYAAWHPYEPVPHLVLAASLGLAVGALVYAFDLSAQSAGQAVRGSRS